MASGVGFELDRAALPRQRGCSVEAALGDGEDYELLFALAARDAKRLEGAWAAAHPKLPLTRIGRLVEDVSAGGELRGGWDHFERMEKGTARTEKRGGKTDEE